jgi:hypothetical protein
MLMAYLAEGEMARKVQSLLEPLKDTDPGGHSYWMLVSYGPDKLTVTPVRPVVGALPALEMIR